MVDSLLEKAPTNTKNPNFCYSWCYITLKDFFNTRDFVHNLGITSREECDECCKSRNKEIFRGAIITICLCQIRLYTISFYCYKCYQVCFPVTSCYLLLPLHTFADLIQAINEIVMANELML
jgi:hypothetical protein